MTDDRSTTDIDIARLREEIGSLIEFVQVEREARSQSGLSEYVQRSIDALAIAEKLPSLLDAIAARDAEIERLTKERDETKHEAECLQARIAEIDYPCSPHCDGYLREFKTRRQNAALAEALRNLLPNYLAWKETGCGVTRIDVRLDDLRAARAALSALDAPTQAQPNASAVATEAVEIMRPFAGLAKQIDTDWPRGAWMQATDDISQRQIDLPKSIPDDFVLLVVVGEVPGGNSAFPLTAGELRAARAFVERHSGAANRSGE